MVDEVASNLVCSGARTHRRKLVRALLQPPRHRPEALPHYARLAATLALCFKHVDSELAALLKVRVRARLRVRVRVRARVRARVRGAHLDLDTLWVLAESEVRPHLIGVE